MDGGSLDPPERADEAAGRGGRAVLCEASGVVGDERRARLRVRRARPDDVDAIVALVHSAYRGEASRAGWTTEADLLDGQRTDPEEVAALVAGAEDLVVLALDDHDLIGSCHLRRLGADVAYFGMFAVRPASQGAGVGSSLLAEAERTAVSRWGVHTMRMTVIRQREELIAWYARRGYQPTGEREPFPYGDERFGLPRRDDLEFLVLAKRIA